MQNEETAGQNPPGKKERKPAYRLSIVIDRENAEPEWVEITALWPTKKGTGFTGRTGKFQVLPEGARLVLTKAVSTGDAP
jgi:hypothetical protein